MDEKKEFNDETINTEEINDNQIDENEPIIADLTDASVANAQDSIDGEYNGKQNLGDFKSYFKPITYVVDTTHSIDDDIDKTRKKYTDLIKKYNILDLSSLILMVVAFIGVILVTFLNTDEKLAWLTWTILAIAIVIIIGGFVLSHFTGKKRRTLSIDYLTSFEDTLNGYVNSYLNVDEALLAAEGQIDDQLIIQSHCFKTINTIYSRAVVLGKRNGHDFTSAEVSVAVPTITFEDANKLPESFVNLDGTPYFPEANTNLDTSTQELPATDMTLVDLDLAHEITGEKKKPAKKKPEDTNTSVGLFGKYYSYDAKVTHQESMIISIMGTSKFTYLPDHLNGFTPVKVPGLKRNIVVFLADPKSSSIFFDEEGVRLLNDININTVVESLFISINSYGMKAGMMLSDDIMELPLKRIQHSGCYDIFKDESVKVFRFFDHVESKKQ